MRAREIVTPTAVPVPVARSLAPGAPEECPGHDRSPGALDLGGTGISKSTARRSRLQELLARIRDGEPMQKVLDVAKRRLRLDGVDLGGRLSESSWAFLDTLTEFHPRGFDRASDNDGILVPEHRIANRISACNARRELQRQLPQGVKAKWFVQTIQGKGYRLRADVRIRGRGEAGLQFHDGQKLAVLYPHDGGAEA